jgi:hypothetical protein
MRATLLALLFAASPALACGVCVEDKIASTYDHAVIKQAVARKHSVAFFHIDGPVTSDAKHWLEATIAATAGIDKGSGRVAVHTSTLSVAYDPRRTSLAQLQASLEKRIASRSLSLLLLREIDR